MELAGEHGTSIREKLHAQMIKLQYGRTNTFLIRGTVGNLLVDTDYPGTLYSLYKALRNNHLSIKDIQWVLATHYHPDHMGLISALMEQGVRLLVMDVQKDDIHFSDAIFARDRIPYSPIQDEQATIITCEGSREFLKQLRISGEIISTPSHSKDSVCLVLDEGECLAGDLVRYECLEAYENGPAERNDWQNVMLFHPKRILYAHGPEEVLC